MPQISEISSLVLLLRRSQRGERKELHGRSSFKVCCARPRRRLVPKVEDVDFRWEKQGSCGQMKAALGSLMFRLTSRRGRVALLLASFAAGALVAILTVLPTPSIEATIGIAVGLLSFVLIGALVYLMERQPRRLGLLPGEEGGTRRALVLAFLAWTSGTLFLLSPWIFTPLSFSVGIVILVVLPALLFWTAIYSTLYHVFGGASGWVRLNFSLLLYLFLGAILVSVVVLIRAPGSSQSHLLSVALVLPSSVALSLALAGRYDLRGRNRFLRGALPWIGYMAFRFPLFVFFEQQALIGFRFDSALAVLGWPAFLVFLVAWTL